MLLDHLSRFTADKRPLLISNITQMNHPSLVALARNGIRELEQLVSGNALLVSTFGFVLIVDQSLTPNL
jgi:hypothetical protein